MAQKAEFQPDLWENRFVRPKADELVEQVAEPHRSLLSDVRESLAEAGLKESVEWLGVSWKWSLSYRGHPRDVQACAFVVPQPDNPRVCMPIADGDVDRLGISDISKSARERVVFAPLVGPVRWPEWEITSRSTVDEVVGLVRAKLSLENECAAS